MLWNFQFTGDQDSLEEAHTPSIAQPAHDSAAYSSAAAVGAHGQQAQAH